MSAASASERRTGPLDGITVVEFGRFVTAPFAACLLADMGADVIKLETPDGDPFRIFGKPGAPSPHFIALNRNKRSVVLDLKTDEGRAQARALICRADVFLENSRPGGMERLGLSYEQVRAEAPGLIYCSITGAGDDGPYAARPAYDMVGQALSGLASQFIDDKNPAAVGPNLSDSLTGMTAAYGVLSALVGREREGKGQRVSVNMLSSGLGLLWAEAQIWFLTGESPGPQTRPASSSSFVVRCKDGKLIGLHLSSVDKFWHGLLAAIGRSELADDARFLTRADRVRNYDALQDILNGVIAQADRDEWVQRLVANDVPSAPVNSIAEVFADEQVRHLDLVQELKDSDGNSQKFVRSAVRLSGTPVEIWSVPPRLGEHTKEVLDDLGISRAEDS